MENQMYKFIGADSDWENSNIVIFGAPFDGTTSFRPGARFGPSAIRTESFGIETYSPYLDMDLTDCKIFDAGDLELPCGSAKKMLHEIERMTQQIMGEGKIPIMLGGEHLVTLGAVRAAMFLHHDISIFHFDAHADLRDEYLGEKLSHACVMRRCQEEVSKFLMFMTMHNKANGKTTSNPKELCGKIIHQFGIRSGDRSEFEWAKENTQLHKFNFDGLESAIEANSNVYLTIDLDVLDPSVLCGTGTPEAGGVTFEQLRKAIELIAKNTNIIGADIVELSPHYDQSGASTALACKLLRELILSINISKNGELYA